MNRSLLNVIIEPLSALICMQPCLKKKCVRKIRQWKHMGILHIDAWSLEFRVHCALLLVEMSIDGGREFQLDLWDFYYAEDH